MLATACVLGRTGWQTYSIGDLPQEQAQALGVDISNGNASIDLYRPAEEVFHNSCLASATGKSVTLQHPPEFVDPDNSREYTRGNIHNPRKGTEPLECGEMPLLGDLLITDGDLINRVEHGLRPLSLGYSYVLKKTDDGKLIQSDIRINHCAVVDAARAGPEARIYDSTKQDSTLTESDLFEGHVETKIEEIKQPAVRQSPKGEYKVANIFKDMLGRGIISLFADEKLSPEQKVDAAVAAARALDSEESEEEKEKKKEEDAKRMKDAAEEESNKKKEAEDKMAADKKAKDESEAEEKKAKDAKDKADKETADKMAKDAAEAAEKSHFMPCKVKDCMARDCRMHGALDSVLKEHPEEEDADMNELSELMGNYMSGQGSEDAGEAEVIEPVPMGGEMDSEEEKEKEKQMAKDSADELAFLKRMRPIVAKSNDEAIKSEFNARLKRYTGSSKVSTGTYAGAAQAAGRARDIKPQGAKVDYSKLQADMDARRGKPGSKITQEVK